MNSMTSSNDKAEFIKLFDKYVPQSIDLILEGIMDGRQVEKLKTIVPLSNLNMVKLNTCMYFYKPMKIYIKGIFMVCFTP